MGLKGGGKRKENDRVNYTETRYICKGGGHNDMH
jgi:hypothetical protein